MSVAMQLQGESPRMGDFMFGRLIEPGEEDDGSSLEGSDEEEQTERKEDELERDVDMERREGFVQDDPMSTEDMDKLEQQGREKLGGLSGVAPPSAEGAAGGAAVETPGARPPGWRCGCVGGAPQRMCDICGSQWK